MSKKYRKNEPEKSAPIKIRPLNEYQKGYQYELNGGNSIIIVSGPAGCGKTLLACVAGMQGIKAKLYDKLVITRPVVESGERIGYLPGELDEKLAPYMAPIIDACHFAGEDIAKVKSFVEIAPLAYMRGRTFRRSFVIADEMQNATHEQLLMLLTRIGEGTKMVITGDVDQTDLPVHRVGALARAIKRLKGIDGIIPYLFPPDSSVRHPLIGKILKAM